MCIFWTGSPIRHIEPARQGRTSPVRHIESARNGREKGGRWSISNFFRKKSGGGGKTASGSESDLTIENEREFSTPPTFSAVDGGGGRLSCGRESQPPPLPPKRSDPGIIFPHLTADYLYPSPSPAFQVFKIFSQIFFSCSAACL